MAIKSFYKSLLNQLTIAEIELKLIAKVTK